MFSNLDTSSSVICSNLKVFTMGCGRLGAGAVMNSLAKVLPIDVKNLFRIFAIEVGSNTVLPSSVSCLMVVAGGFRLEV